MRTQFSICYRNCSNIPAGAQTKTSVILTRMLNAMAFIGNVFVMIGSGAFCGRANFIHGTRSRFFCDENQLRGWSPPFHWMIDGCSLNRPSNRSHKPSNSNCFTFHNGNGLELSCPFNESSIQINVENFSSNYFSWMPQLIHIRHWHCSAIDTTVYRHRSHRVRRCRMVLRLVFTNFNFNWNDIPVVQLTLEEIVGFARDFGNVSQFDGFSSTNFCFFC